MSGVRNFRGTVWRYSSQIVGNAERGAFNIGSLTAAVGLRLVQSDAYRFYLGSSWDLSSGSHRATPRCSDAPDVQGDYLGFRLAKEAV